MWSNKMYGLFAAAVLAFLAGAASASITIATVPVGNAGNAADTTGFGEVDYAYNIGEYDVTSSQYAAFLNAVAETDPYGVYNSNMAGTTNGNPGIIQRFVGRYAYSVAAGRGNYPVTDVTFWDATRFANWLDNGQPTGPEGAGTTETGAYTLTPTGIANNTVTRNAGATWAVTSENEWYKAAYFTPLGGTGNSNPNYWLYPTQSNTISTSQANYNGVVGDTTPVGSYAYPSYYGTYDQGGDVINWNESIYGSYRGLRGGSFDNNDDLLQSGFNDDLFSPSADDNLVGFRVSQVPGTLTWNDAGGSPQDGLHWDIDNNQNWNNGTSVSVYGDGSTVTFNDFNAGNYAVTLNITVNPASVTVNSSGNYTISGIGSIGGTGSLTKMGSSTLTLSTVNTYSGGTNVTGGTLIVGTHGALPSNQAVTLAGGMLQLAPHTGGETVSSLSITGGSTLDLTNNHIVIDYGVPADQTTVDSAIRSYISSGEIFSSEPNGTYGVGYADGNDASESGIVSANSVLVAYALYGDANLDGVVNGSDFTILASHLGKSVTGWDQGDFFYTGTVTGADFTALVSNLGKSASGADVAVPASDYTAIDAFAEANGLMADVPEPSTFALAALGATGLLARRRRPNLLRP